MLYIGSVIHIVFIINYTLHSIHYTLTHINCMWAIYGKVTRLNSKSDFWVGLSEVILIWHLSLDKFWSNCMEGSASRDSDPKWPKIYIALQTSSKCWIGSLPKTNFRKFAPESYSRRHDELPTQTMHFYKGIFSKLPYLYIFAMFDPPKIGNSMTPVLSRYLAHLSFLRGVVLESWGSGWVNCDSSIAIGCGFPPSQQCQMKVFFVGIFATKYIKIQVVTTGKGQLGDDLRKEKSAPFIYKNTNPPRFTNESLTLSSPGNIWKNNHLLKRGFCDRGSFPNNHGPSKKEGFESVWRRIVPWDPMILRAVIWVFPKWMVYNGKPH